MGAEGWRYGVKISAKTTRVKNIALQKQESKAAESLGSATSALQKRASATCRA